MFIISCLWHGANWTFIVWGTLFAIVYLTEKALNTLFRINREAAPYSVWHILLVLKTFILVTFIWVFFRSQSIMDALQLGKHILIPGNQVTTRLEVPVLTWALLGIFILSDILLYNKRFDSWIGKMPLLLRWSIYTLIIFTIIVFSGVENFPFIYFQF
ncbi:MAG: hypothetical protein JW801_17765 [Bacteroidales bacterium]|nr:hypothetical protein [Bacteroidales bacterium]